MGLQILLECFSIDVNYSLEAPTGRLNPKKERLINKHRVLRRSNSNLDTDSSKNTCTSLGIKTHNQHCYFLHPVHILAIKTSNSNTLNKI